MMISVLRFKYLFTVIFLTIGITLWLSYPRYYQFNGPVFGTYYKIIVVAPKYAFNEKKTNESIQLYLKNFDKIFSTYRDDSEIMKLNQADIGHPVQLDPKLVAIISLSKTLQNRLGPVWDPTIVPISQKYGFKTTSLTKTLKVGLNYLSIINETQVKKLEHIALDLSSIAKGVAVDGLSSQLNEMNIVGSYVDIGGEIKTTGTKTGKKPWGIGIQSPSKPKALANVIYASNVAIATSGNYLNYNNIDGQKVGHILDPVQKRPVDHSLLSVSILSNHCSEADAIATGVYVMGPDKAQIWLKNNPDIPALLILNKDDKESLIYVNGFDRFLNLANNSFF